MHALLEAVQRKCFLYGLSLGYISRTIRQLAASGGNIKLPHMKVMLFLCQRVNTATSSPADDVHHYVTPEKLLLTNRFYSQQTSGGHIKLQHLLLAENYLRPNF
jgi:hypothetical protein